LATTQAYISFKNYIKTVDMFNEPKFRYQLGSGTGWREISTYLSSSPTALCRSHIESVAFAGILSSPGVLSLSMFEDLEWSFENNAVISELYSRIVT